MLRLLAVVLLVLVVSLLSYYFSRLQYSENLRSYTTTAGGIVSALFLINMFTDYINIVDRTFGTDFATGIPLLAALLWISIVIQNVSMSTELE